MTWCSGCVCTLTRACLSLPLWALQDLEKTQEDVLKHQASISELKRSFMEATPEPRPSQWDKRLTGSPATTLRMQASGVRVLLTPGSTRMFCTSCHSRMRVLYLLYGVTVGISEAFSHLHVPVWKHVSLPLCLLSVLSERKVILSTTTASWIHLKMPLSCCSEQTCGNSDVFSHVTHSAQSCLCWSPVCQRWFVYRSQYTSVVK